MFQDSYTVIGMTCQHCASSVTEHLSKIPSVTDVAVDVARDTVRVSSSEPLDNSTVAAAVESAGYALAETG